MKTLGEPTLEMFAVTGRRRPGHRDSVESEAQSLFPEAIPKRFFNHGGIITR